VDPAGTDLLAQVKMALSGDETLVDEVRRSTEQS
jgi:hypothetical protein